jgi:hypothetical protein
MQPLAHDRKDSRVVGGDLDRALQHMPDDSLKILLSGGGSVAISEYGDKDGAPVFFCHGWPS